MQTASADGLHGAGHHRGSGQKAYRCTIKTLHNAPGSFKKTLVEMWGSKTAQEAHATLSKRDVEVTNKSDKDKQLPKLLKLDEMVRGVFAHLASTQEAAQLLEKAVSAEARLDCILLLTSYFLLPTSYFLLPTGERRGSARRRRARGDRIS